MKVTNFRDLSVWKKSHQLVLKIYSITRKYPKSERFGLTNQVHRSAVSICANIVEGYMKNRNDFVRYLNIARGSLEETKYYLILSKDLHYFSFDQFEILYNEADEVGKMLYRLKQGIISRANEH